jgi:serine/threonine protein kinase
VRRKGRGDATEMFPGYTDLAEVGGGAFATVFRAIEAETGRSVALKVLNLDTIHSHLLETFRREIQALASVSGHPNIVTLYRPGETADGRPVLVLELCRESLAQQLRDRGPLAAADVSRIGVKIAGALETAHRNGFLHRDMKPQNLLTTFFGEPALADFGVAALQASAQSTAGIFGFTTLHAAPEMLEGHHLSPATDVYGLASTMYQLLVGRAPFVSFDGEAPASVILRILRDPVPPLRAENVPLALADLLEAALSKQPEGRPRTASDFARALQDVEAGEGWPVTSFTAWGEDGPGSEPARNPGAPEHDAPAGRGPMGVSTASSGTVGPTQSRAGSRLPPLLPPSTRPSLVPPVPVVRNVVDPDGERGRFGTGVAPEPNPPLSAHPPERDGDPGTAPDRPVFVDPEPVRPGGPTADSGSRRADFSEHGAGDYAPVGSVLPSWAAGALVLAALVVVAAVLLLLGVL